MIRVLVAAGSALCRARASALLANRSEFDVLEPARGPADAALKVDSLQPHILLLEPPLLAASRTWGGAGSSVPVILLASSDADPAVLAGLENGAADFVVLPPPGDGAARDEAADRLAMLIRHVTDEVRRAERTLPVGAPVPIALPPGPESPIRLVLVGASTGGPRAVQTLLQGLPPALGAPILVALHMPASFTRVYAERLDRACALPVAEASDAEALRAGSVRIVPGGKQGALVLRGDRLHVRLRRRGPEELHAPSIDQLMRSAAVTLGAAALGILLTGMGGDGCAGLEAIHRAGGTTLAESESSALVFGMPGEAIRAGAASAALPLEKIAEAVLMLCGAPADERSAAGTED